MGKLRVVKSLVVCCLPLLMTIRGAAQQPLAIAHSSTLSGLSADLLENGDVIISSEALGDLRGLVTLTLHPYAGGYIGEWAFTVAHADNTDPATGVDPELAEGPHNDNDGDIHHSFLRLVQQGTLQGTVNAASLSLDTNGALTGVSAALTIDKGAREFDGATGTGQATLDSLTLIF